MALSDKNIVITPNIGSSSDPKIVFSGADASTGAQNITLQVYPTNSGTLSFEGSAGQLFSISNTMTGTIFSANDVSGIPSIEVLDNGLVKLAQYGGNVVLGTGLDNSSDKLQVTGSIRSTTNITAAGQLISTVSTGTAPFVVSSSTVVNNLNAQYWNGYTFSNYLNQSVLTTSSPTFGQVYNNGWFRNNSSNTGLYNESSTQHWSSQANGWWDGSSTSAVSFSGIRFYTGGHVSALRGSIEANTSNEVIIKDSGGNNILKMKGGSPHLEANSFRFTGQTHYYTGAVNTSDPVSFVRDGASGSVTFELKESGSVSDSDSYGVLWLTRTNHTNGNDAGANLYFRVKDSGGTPQEYAGVGGRRNGSNTEGRLNLWVYGRSNVAYCTSSGMFATSFLEFNNSSYYADLGNSGTSINVAGAIVAAGNITAYSDIRVKTDIRPITDAVNKVKQLNGVTFLRTDIDDKDRRQTGVIAQEVLKVLPEAVRGSERTKYTVAYGNMVGLLIEAIKEQQSEIEELKNMVKQLVSKDM